MNIASFVCWLCLLTYDYTQYNALVSLSNSFVCKQLAISNCKHFSDIHHNTINTRTVPTLSTTPLIASSLQILLQPNSIPIALILQHLIFHKALQWKWWQTEAETITPFDTRNTSKWAHGQSWVQALMGFYQTWNKMDSKRHWLYGRMSLDCVQWNFSNIHRHHIVHID